MHGKAGRAKGRACTGVMDDIDGLRVVTFVPQAISGCHHKLVVRAEVPAGHLRVRNQALALQVVVPQAPAHATQKRALMLTPCRRPLEALWLPLTCAA